MVTEFMATNEVMKTTIKNHHIVRFILEFLCRDDGCPVCQQHQLLLVPTLLKQNMQQEDKNMIFQMRFPQKLWYLLNMNTDSILWGGTGRTILLNFRILHTYLQCDQSIFKTTNISSFVRQLNLYGFRKVTSHLQDPLCNSCNPYMHEYVHDYFQYGRPELLNKITRKALTLRKNFKLKDLYTSNADQLKYLTPLQKARRNLRVALKKAAQDNFLEHSPQEYCNLNNESEDQPDDICDSEEIIDWFLPKNFDKPINTQQTITTPKSGYKENIETEINDTIGNMMQMQQDNNINVRETNDHFPAQFLSMPDLDPNPRPDHVEVELLAEFNIDHNPDISITKDLNGNKENEPNSLNCVLPSITDDSNDVSISERVDNIDQYSGEWDQMFRDIMTNKVSSQESGSELKELYSQISRTIDLLND